ncbi:MAG: NAD-dependent epimerase/dehydratase family protein [Actinomycetes bacterium]
MRLLIIGGTSFLGRATADEALRRGWDVTTFNRGVSGQDVDGVEALRGDRTSADDLARLAGRPFDVVVDTCGFVPAVVGRSVKVLAGSGAHYVYVSSMSACPTWPAQPTPDGVEGHPCPSDAGPDDGDYGTLKAGCERAVTEVLAGGSTIVRAGLILGPHENVGRLPWWLSRIARGGEVLAPGDPALAMQLVDARDLAAFMLDTGSAGAGGTINATGPAGNATMGGWLGDCVTATGSGADLTWVADDFLVDHEVEPWTELPLWMPPGQDGDHVWNAETAAAERAGLRCRPVAETVRDTWAWMQSGGRVPEEPPHDHLPRHGIAGDKEARILADWHARG